MLLSLPTYFSWQQSIQLHNERMFHHRYSREREEANPGQEEPVEHNSTLPGGGGGGAWWWLWVREGGGGGPEVVVDAVVDEEFGTRGGAGAGRWWCPLVLPSTLLENLRLAFLASSIPPWVSMKSYTNSRVLLSAIFFWSSPTCPQQQK